MVWNVGPRLGVAAGRHMGKRLSMAIIPITYMHSPKSGVVEYPAGAATPRRGPTATNEPVVLQILLD